MAKIVLVSFTFHPENNGVANVVKTHANYFHELGHDVTIVTTKAISNSEETLTLPFNVVGFDINGGFKVFDVCRGEIREYIKFMQTLEADVVFFHCWQIWTTDLILFFKEKKIKYKKVIVSHGTSFNTRYSLKSIIISLLLQPYRFIIKQLIKKVNKVIVLSTKIDFDRFYDAYLLENYIDKKVVIPNSIPNDICAPPHVLETYNLKVQQYIISVANFQPLKNQQDLIFAYKNLPQILRDKYQLVLVGSYETAYLNYLKKLITSYSLNKNIKIIVNIKREESLALIKNAKILVSSSKTECLSVTILEALGFTVPVVSSNVGASCTIDGVIIYDNIKECSAQIEKLIENPSYYIKTKKVLEQQIPKYSNDVVLHKYKILIEELISDN